MKFSANNLRNSLIFSIFATQRNATQRNATQRNATQRNATSDLNRQNKGVFFCGYNPAEWKFFLHSADFFVVFSQTPVLFSVLDEENE